MLLDAAHNPDGAAVLAEFLEREGEPYDLLFGALAATAQGKFLPQTGAVVIKDAHGNVLGAAGASGGTGEEDEAACAHGIEQAGLFPDATG